MTDYREYEPLEWIEDEGRWSWPPKKAGNGKMFKSTELQMREVLWATKHAGGEFVAPKAKRRKGPSVSAIRLLTEAMGLPANISQGRLMSIRNSMNDLVGLGLYVVEKPSPDAKMFTRLALNIPLDQVPGEDPFPPTVNQQELLDALEATDKQAFIKDAGDSDTGPIWDETPQYSGPTASEVAHAMLEEYATLKSDVEGLLAQQELSQAPVAAERNHLAERLGKANDRINALEKDLEILGTRVRSLQGQLAVERENYAQSEKNKAAALDEVARLQAQYGVTASENAQRAVRQMVERPPSDYRER